MTKWHQIAETLHLPSRALIGGALKEASDGGTLPAINPATGAEIARVAACTADDVHSAVVAARASFDGGAWSRAAPAHRKAALLRLAELLRAELDRLAVMESLDMGKLVTQARGNDLPNAIGILQWHAEEADKAYGETTSPRPGNTVLIERVPLGVVGAVVPWNFPLNMALWKCTPALAAGNSVVLKPAEQSNFTALRFGELALEAGLPEGVLNVVPGHGAVAGRALGLHPDVDVLAFTGSTEVGRLFLQYAGQSNLKQVWLECGGKSPLIVFADCDDLPGAAAAAAEGIFYNQGQVCSATSRVLVDRKVAAPFAELLRGELAKYRPGDPLDPASGMGPLVSAAQQRRVLGYIEAGRREATLLAGGGQPEGTGFHVEPTILTDVPPGATIAQEEIFGPVLAVTTFESEAEAIALANGSAYGLAASLWTSDFRRAHRVAAAIRAGLVAVNAVDPIDPAVPFGGFRQSGFGRDLSRHAAEKYTGLRSTWLRFAS
ncbi:aldehyde dehydrogenase family protein [Pseudoroseicyclus sp. CXY001]|uniref:aldehyde dehydrogenase family protein n=1 Tax=Pseudoroseicyclus sp. CXY001 TaxID=3242492 RepID=UPI00358DB3FF